VSSRKKGVTLTETPTGAVLCAMKNAYKKLYESTEEG
jgi:hypothetical protein